MHINVSKVGARRMVPVSSVVHSNRRRSNGHKLKHKKFHLNIRKNFALKVAEQLEQPA